MANGQGRLIHADGDIYEGDWKNDKGILIYIEQHFFFFIFFFISVSKLLYLFIILFFFFKL